MATVVRDNVDYRLLNNLSNLVICSHCLRNGRVTPVPQIISADRKVRNVCSDCRDDASPISRRRVMGKLLPFRRKPARQ